MRKFVLFLLIDFMEWLRETAKSAEHFFNSRLPEWWWTGTYEALAKMKRHI